MSDFDVELKQVFLEEAAQLIADTEQCFLLLEAHPEDQENANRLFRLAHNLKGSGSAAGFADLGVFTHKLESMLLRLKNGEIKAERSVVSLLLACNDHLQRWVKALKSDLSVSVDSSDLLNELEKYLSDSNANHSPKTIEPSSGVVFFDSPPPVEPTAANAAERVPKIARQASPVAADESIRVSLARLDKLINYVGEMVILQSVLREQSHSNDFAGTRKSLQQLGKVTKEVQEISMNLRMLPLKQLFHKMQRIVRDTSAELKKDIQLAIEGEETEVDKTILESISDPLVHLIRNAVDHGIEAKEKRLAMGKTGTGTITLKAYHQSGKLVIEVNDDGGGLDPEGLKAKAVEKGILHANVDLKDRDAYQLIFAPGFSTKSEVTGVSGRGVGMDVVKTNIDALQGDIQIETAIGKGTLFKIRLPLTLAIIDGMIVKSSTDSFIIPLAHVYETMRPLKDNLHSVSGMGMVLSLRSENLPFFRLNDLLLKGSKTADNENAAVIIVHGQHQNFAVLVDEIIERTQVVVKQLGPECQEARGFSGSAILGDGKPALILELEDLCLRAQKNGSKPPMQRKAV